MPVGRGSKERHRTPRQKRAAWINKYGHPDLVDRYIERRKKRIKGQPKKMKLKVK